MHERLSARGWTVAQIAEYLNWHQKTVRETIHRWQRGGLSALWMGLCIQDLDDRTLTLAANYKRRFPTLCLVESFALALAKMSSFVMLSGNPILHQLAISERVDYHKLFWLLDRIVNEKVISFDSLCTGLLALLNSPCCYLRHYELNEWIQQVLKKQ